MKKTEVQGIKYALAAVVLFLAIGYGGKCDYNDSVILHMSQSDYDSIVAQYKESHGHEPSENEIVKIYDEYYR